MGKQYNKVVKRKRRQAYLQRKVAAQAAAVKTKTAPVAAKPAKKAPKAEAAPKPAKVPKAKAAPQTPAPRRWNPNPSTRPRRLRRIRETPAVHAETPADHVEAPAPADHASGAGPRARGQRRSPPAAAEPALENHAASADPVVEPAAHTPEEPGSALCFNLSPARTRTAFPRRENPLVPWEPKPANTCSWTATASSLPGPNSAPCTRGA